ncbi:MAG: hypothetical protein V1876_04495, partial [Candidatus Peregrinibacteria bacterium]
LFTAMLQDPQKIILFMDPHRELLGEAFRHYEGVAFVETESELSGQLERIRAGACERKAAVQEPGGCASAAEVVAGLLDGRA